MSLGAQWPNDPPFRTSDSIAVLLAYFQLLQSYPLHNKNETEAWTLHFTAFVGLNLLFHSILKSSYVFIKSLQHIFEAYNICVKLWDIKLM